MLGEEVGQGTGRKPAERRNVIAALRRHGISGAVTATLWNAARDLRTRTRWRGIEHAVTLDAATGEPVGPMVTGSVTATDLSRHVLAFQRGHGYVSLHTHPRSTSFSPQDLLFVATQPDVRASVVVAVDGTWYVLNRSSKTPHGDPRDSYDAYQALYQQLQQEQVASAERPHIVMERIAGTHGFRYDRVMGS